MEARDTGSLSADAFVAASVRCVSFCHGYGHDMAHWKKAFPSKYLQAADLDRPIIATITSVRSVCDRLMIL